MIESPQTRYVFRTVAFMAVYVALNTAAIFGLFDGRNQLTSWGLSLAVAIPIAGQIWAVLALMREVDEFVRGVMAKRFIIASGLAMAALSTWGFLESYARTPHVPGWMIYPMFWAAYGLISPFVRTSR
jgi:putative oxidoreductase